MENAKKIILIILVIFLVIGSSLGSFYFFKKYFTKQPPNLDQTLAINKPEDIIPGFQRDLTNKPPLSFPEGLVVEKNIANIVESFKSVRFDGRTEYNFKYISNLTQEKTVTFFRTYLDSGIWSLEELMVDKTDRNNPVTAIKSISKNKESILASIQRTSLGVTVSIVYIK